MATTDEHNSAEMRAPGRLEVSLGCCGLAMQTHGKTKSCPRVAIQLPLTEADVATLHRVRQIVTTELVVTLGCSEEGKFGRM